MFQWWFARNLHASSFYDRLNLVYLNYSASYDRIMIYNVMSIYHITMHIYIYMYMIKLNMI